MSMIACAEFDKSVGKNLVGGDQDGVIAEMTFPVSEITSYEHGDALKFSSTALHLGEMDEFHSDIVLWFPNFSSLGEVLELDSTRLKLFSSGYLDAESIEDETPWEAELLRFDENFDPIYNDFVSAQDYQMTPIDTIFLDAEDSALDTFDIKEYTMELDTLTLDTLLLYLRPLDDEAGFIKRFVPWSSVADPLYLPQIRASGDFVVDGDTLRDTTLVVNPVYTTFYTDDSGVPDDAERIITSQSYLRDVVVKGDFTRIDPASMSLNRVDLVITVDSDWNRNLGDPTAYTWYDVLADWDLDPDTLEVGSPSELAYFIPDSTMALRINVTPLARQWVALPETNFGLAFKPIIAGNSIARRAFYSNDPNVDSTLRPYFHVIYTEFTQP